MEIAKGQNPSLILAGCDAPPQGYKSVGISLRVMVPEGQPVTRISGRHDFGYEISLGEDSESPVLSLISGSNLDGFPNRFWLGQHPRVQVVELFHRAGPRGAPELIGLDVRGETDHRRRSRIVSTTGEVVEYFTASTQWADRFDAWLRSLCLETDPLKQIR